MNLVSTTKSEIVGLFKKRVLPPFVFVLAYVSLDSFLINPDDGSWLRSVIVLTGCTVLIPIAFYIWYFFLCRDLDYGGVLAVNLSEQDIFVNYFSKSKTLKWSNLKSYRIVGKFYKYLKLYSKNGTYLEIDYQLLSKDHQEKLLEQLNDRIRF